LEKAANHIRDWVLSLKINNLTCEIIKDEGYSPILYTEVKGDIDHTLFFYGHYDKQPPFVGWMEGIGPTNPKIIDGKLYGRGGADDGYSTYSTMLALKGLQ
jgi:acetylornithine deacetylase/succinyl-diaminopimelate desuccinylase-like protein